MRRSGLRSLAICLLLGLAATACGSSQSTSSSMTTHLSSPTATAPPGAAGNNPNPGGLTVSPSSAHPTSTVRFSFTAPQTTGRHGGQITSYVVDANGPVRHAGCQSSHQAAVPAVAKGATARAALGPAQLGGNWCVGSYTAQVQELARASCAPGQMCPMYVRVVGTVASARFTVAR